MNQIGSTRVDRTDARPLVVDLDGTLIRSDLLVETGFSELTKRPGSAFDMLAAARRGKAALKHRIAEPVDFDPATLPYDEEVLAIVRAAVDEGRPVYLASASTRRLVQAIADHLGLFSGWFASDEMNNLAGRAKARQLVEAFGERGFDYVGNDRADLDVWPSANRAYAIRASGSVMRRLRAMHGEVVVLPDRPVTWREWTRLLRVHQYAKNALIFLPLLLAHDFSPASTARALVTFAAFCLCASSVYLLNDLVDVQADRRHRSKRFRPLASGRIPMLHAFAVAPLLLLASVAVAAIVSLETAGVLLLYYATTLSYTFWLKYKLLIDVVALAMLYAVRVLAGSVATAIPISPWLLAFCGFLFISLAMIKRYVELAFLFREKLPDPTNRNYRTGDLPIVGSLAAATGLNAVTVLALYISSADVHGIYARPSLLWLICPLLLYWIARVLVLAHRLEMDDDPIVFALRDPISWTTVGSAALIMMAAS